MDFVDPQKDFIVNALPITTQSLANYMPGGEYFRAKNIESSNLRALLTSLSYEVGRVEAKLKELEDEEYVPDTYNLIEEWERSLGIPDECFSPEGQTIEMRRKYVIAKYALMNLTTTVDFIALADFFGIRVEILNGLEYSNFFPFTFPMYFFGSIKEAKFTMIVHFLDLDRPSNIFPLKFPVTFSNVPNLILCLFEKLKPAPVKIIARYRDD